VVQKKTENKREKHANTDTKRNTRIQPVIIDYRARHI